MRRGPVLVIVLSILCAVAYAASPLWAAWQLKSAVARGDVASVRTRVAWDSVRQSLGRSIARYAGLEADGAMPVGTEQRLTLWGRLKRGLGHRMLDQFIATYVSPEGFIRLHRMRARRHQPMHVVRASYAVPRRPATDADQPATNVSQAVGFLERLTRIEFLSLTEVTIELADRLKPDRHFVLQFGLRRGGWLLTGIKVVRPPPSAPVGVAALN